MLDCGNTDARPGVSMHPYHSVWMAHWMRKSCDSTSGVDNHLSFHDEKKKDDHDNKQSSFLVQTDECRKGTRSDVVRVGPSNFSKHISAMRCRGGLYIESDGPHSSKEVVAVTDAERVEMRDGALPIKLLNFSNVRKWQSFPMINFNERKESIFTSKKDLYFNGRHQPISQIDVRSEFGPTVLENEAHFSSRVLASAPTGIQFFPRAHHPAEGVPQSSGQLVKPDESPKKKSFPVSRTLQDDHTVSIYGFETRGLLLQSSKFRNRENNPPTFNECVTKCNFGATEHKICNCCRYSTFLVCDEKIDDRLTAKYSGHPPLKQHGESQQLRVLSTSDVRFPITVGKQNERCNFPGSECLTSHSCPPGIAKSEELNYGSHSLHQMPKCSVHDADTPRICPTVDSVEALPGGSSKISLPTHNMLITEKTDVNLSEDGKVCRESTVSNELKGNAFHELLTLPPDFGCHTRAKLHSLRNSVDNEVTGDVWNAKLGSEGFKNVSSAETDAMDFDILQERNSLPDPASYPSNKDVCQSPAKSQATIASLREKVGSRKAEADLPDMFQVPPASAEGGGIGDRELISSRTESLEVDHLLSFDEQQLAKSSFSPHRDSPQCLKPDSRWVKRRQVSSWDCLSFGTRYSKMGDASASEKVNKVFSKIMNRCSSSSQDKLGKYFGKGKMDNETMVLPRNRESSSMDSVKEHLDFTYSWVQRWCHNKSAAQLVKPRVNLVGEPHSSKAALYEFERKQFPSIAARALMWKYINGFRSCEFRRRGSFVVWNNTEGF
ncbi:uncharacterized protein LOC122661732 [Telopea speciosissima]|uniref:uncharacterized protein LOC122661732 n=1 Tax=Telopea speciosissima TaxID=54955 RepID=UPI001CC48FAA|nr:uncharacterized protein LOC122661732 [Telopea speciosissima]